MSFTSSIDASQQSTSRRNPLKVQVEASRVLEYASEVLAEVFGKEQAFHVKPLFLKNRTLTLTCSNSSMAQKIREHQVELMDKINDKLGKKEVDCIRYLA